MKEGGNLARTIPTSNPDPDQEQGGLSVWCGVNRQRAERSRALGPVRPTSDATRAANAAQPTARRRMTVVRLHDVLRKDSTRRNLHLRRHPPEPHFRTAATHVTRVSASRRDGVVGEGATDVQGNRACGGVDAGV